MKRTIITTFTFKQILNVCFIFVGRNSLTVWLLFFMAHFYSPYLSP